MVKENRATVFQLTAARRRLECTREIATFIKEFQLTAARRRLEIVCCNQQKIKKVSTHSRPKAAGDPICAIKNGVMFQLTAARRRLANYAGSLNGVWYVSTHSRPKAAGRYRRGNHGVEGVSTHSRPKAAGCHT